MRSPQQTLPVGPAPAWPTGLAWTDHTGQIGVATIRPATRGHERLDLISTIINRRIGSAKEITKDEAIPLIDTLEQALQQPDPRAWLTEVIRGLPIDGEVVDPWPDPPAPDSGNGGDQR